jgi:hypothetical protein
MLWPERGVSRLHSSHHPKPDPVALVFISKPLLMAILSRAGEAMPNGCVLATLDTDMMARQ